MESLAPRRSNPFSKVLAGFFIVLFSFSLTFFSTQTLPEGLSDPHGQEFLQTPAPELPEAR